MSGDLTSTPIVRRSRFFWLSCGLALPALGALLVYIGDTKTQNELSALPLTTLTEQLPTAQRIEELTQPVVQPLGMAVDLLVRRNDTLEQLFRQTRVNVEDLTAIRMLPGVREHLDSLKPGERISITHNDGVLQGLVRRLTDTTILSVTRKEAGFEARVVETPIQIRTSSVHGVIDSSLFSSARNAGMSADLIMRLANDIFGWDIDFALEIQPNDQFTVIYEKKFRNGEYLGDGQILAAEFINAGRTYRAVRFESLDGQVADYFTPDGKSMRKQFLRAPVDFKYISSNFNPHRLHPVLNITRAHQGVDYAAPTGTPIKASGDGRVAFAGVKGGYGKAVILEHGGSVSTLYGHMSRFANALREGTRVKQGDIIGFVGSSGLATAPHLHYEYRINGAHKNPRTVALPDAKAIPENYLAEFQSETGRLLAQVDRARAAQLVAAGKN